MAKSKPRIGKSDGYVCRSRGWPNGYGATAKLAYEDFIAKKALHRERSKSDMGILAERDRVIKSYKDKSQRIKAHIQAAYKAYGAIFNPSKMSSEMYRSLVSIDAIIG